MLSLTLIYMVPLFLSARTVSLEFRMLGFYRLVMADLKRLLDAKWRAQWIVNCTIVAALALPFFLLVDRGPQSFEPAYFAAIVVVYVPLLTMLAIALGTLFLHVSEAPSLFGLSPWGFVL